MEEVASLVPDMWLCLAEDKSWAVMRVAFSVSASFALLAWPFL